MIIQHGWDSLYVLRIVFKCELVSVTSCIQQFFFAILVFQLVMKFLLHLTQPFPSLQTFLMSHHKIQDDLWYFTYHAGVFSWSSVITLELHFESSDLAVQFEMCGICLVYEQNVPEFVQTLVECMLGSLDANHQYFSVSLSYQLGMMQYCNHEKENCCPFLPERLNSTGQVFCYHTSMQ